MSYSVIFFFLFVLIIFIIEIVIIILIILLCLKSKSISSSSQEILLNKRFQIQRSKNDKNWDQKEINSQEIKNNIDSNCPSIKIAILNKTTNTSDKEIIKVMDAEQIQITRDFFPYWDIYAKLEFFGNVDIKSIPDPYWVIIIADEADHPNALGYHTLTSAGMPLGKVFVKTTQLYNVPWSLTFSHEVLEMLADPYADISVFVRDSSTTGLIVAYENVDMCQSLGHSYKINGVVVSDFVFPEWFGFYEGKGKYDFMGYITEPLSILPGGYVLAFRVPNDGKEWEVFLANTPPKNKSISDPQKLLSGFRPENLNIKGAKDIVQTLDKFNKKQITKIPDDYVMLCGRTVEQLKLFDNDVIKIQNNLHKEICRNAWFQNLNNEKIVSTLNENSSIPLNSSGHAGAKKYNKIKPDCQSCK